MLLPNYSLLNKLLNSKHHKAKILIIRARGRQMENAKKEGGGFWIETFKSDGGVKVMMTSKSWALCHLELALESWPEGVWIAFWFTAGGK